MKAQRSITWVLGLCLYQGGLPTGLAEIKVQPGTEADLNVMPATMPTPPKVPAGRSIATDGGGVIADAGTQAAETTPRGSEFGRLPPHVRLSPWANEILKLAQAGVGAEVMLSFIENSGLFNLGADQIIHLGGAGVSGEVITAMLRHDYGLASGIRLPTIVSLPGPDPELERLLTAFRNAPRETPKPAASTLIPPPQPELNALPYSTATSDVPVTASVTESSAATTLGAAQAMTDPPANTAVFKSPSKQPQSAYRVPERHAVELAPPIIFVNAASRTPNLVVIELFPDHR